MISLFKIIINLFYGESAKWECKNIEIGKMGYDLSKYFIRESIRYNCKLRVKFKNY